MPTSNIIVVGSVNADLVVKGPRLPGPGETVLGGTFSAAAGGKGANQAVAAARLGGDVTLVAKVGCDAFGDEALVGYRREGLAVDLVEREPNAATGIALILIDNAGENMIAVSSGANALLGVADVERAAGRIAAADVLMLQLEIPLDAVNRAATIASAEGKVVILDPAPAAPLPSELLAQVTYLTPNEHEAEALSGIAVYNEATARRAAEWLRTAGAKNVIITLGAQGALVATDEGMRLIPSHPVNAIDTTAAGDAFNGGLAVALATGLELDAAVRRASLGAALATTRLGAQPSLPTAEEVRRFEELL
jgi:ribokinase